MIKFSRMLLALILCAAVFQASWATTTLPLFASVDAAAFYTRLGTTQQLNLFNNLGNAYRATKHWESSSTFLVGFGARTYQGEHVHFDTSIRYLPIPDTSLSGQIWQLNAEQFHNLAYNYHVKTDVLFIENAMALSQVLLHTPLQPSLILGLGRAVNISHDYQASR